MAYFQQNDTPENEEYRSSWESASPPAELPETELMEEELMEEESEILRRRSRWQVLAGVSDFFGVIAGVAVLLVVVALLVSLFNWVRHDLGASFELLGSGL